MTARGNAPKSSLVDKVLNKRDEEEQKRLGRENVKKLLPDFKQELGDLIQAKIPAPEVEVIIVDDNIPLDYGREGMFGIGSRRDKFDTILTGSITTDKSEVMVTISSSGYPDKNDPESARKLNYIIDLHDLDSILLIEGSKATIQSKKWEMEKFTMSTPIGVPLPSWPAFKNAATEKDFNAYKKLIDDLNQPNVTFTGSTPKIIERDYTEIRARNFANLKARFGVSFDNK